MKCSCKQKQARKHLVSFQDPLQSCKSGNETRMKGSGNETRMKGSGNETRMKGSGNETRKHCK